MKGIWDMVLPLDAV